jgi:hypothetical protein
MKTTCALTIVALLTGFLVACGDMPTSVSRADPASPLFKTGGALGSGGGGVAPSDTVVANTMSTATGTFEGPGPEDDDQEGSRTGGALGSGGG